LIYAARQPVAPNQDESYEPSPLPNDIHARNNENILQTENPNGEPQLKGTEHISPKLENCNFSNSEIMKITNDLKNNIGTGGFGTVYLGHLKNGVQVAVKILSKSSTQGVRQFLAEVNQPPHVI
jgi:hypothetical protein